MKYKGINYKIIKEYPTYMLLEHPAGYKESIHKQELGLIIEQVKPRQFLKTEK